MVSVSALMKSGAVPNEMEYAPMLKVLRVLYLQTVEALEQR